jgi:hypothetical protein
VDIWPSPTLEDTASQITAVVVASARASQSVYLPADYYIIGVSAFPMLEFRLEE